MPSLAVARLIVGAFMSSALFKALIAFQAAPAALPIVTKTGLEPIAASDQSK
jgi:hypothetical protein